MALLTPRQAEVLALVGEGLRFSEIATRLSTSETSIKMHVSAMLRLLAVSNRTRAASVRQAAHRFGAAHPIGRVS
ncbi:response regulator transcription factor [Pandoraea pnomenusa]